MRRRTEAATPLDGADGLLLDLDGVVYRGADAIPGAVEAITTIAGRGVRVGYITNNASRTPETVADQLRGFGLELSTDAVVTSPQAAVRLMADRLAPDARILVIGGEGLRTAVRDAGYPIVESADDAPDAVVQGFSQDLGWKDLAEASFALADEKRVWIATNTDWTIPVARGLAPGNGTLVSAVHAAVGRMPVVAGKPETPIFEEAVRRFGLSSPIFVGDRLDTDIAGARAAGIRSALVLTGVDGARELLSARAELRPDLILAGLPALLEPLVPVEETRDGHRSGDAVVRLDGRRLEVRRPGDPVDLLRAACAAVWAAPVSAYALDIPDEILRAGRSRS